jgi:Sec-independent protein translocase protein TatA
MSLRIGPGELLVIAILFLLFFGPERFGQAARRAGEAFRTYRKARETINQVKNPANWVKVIDVQPDKTEPKKPSADKPA